MTARSERIPWAWPAAGTGLAIVFGMAHWVVGRSVGFPFAAFFLAAFWGYVEWMKARGEPDRPEAIAIHNTHRIVFTAIGLYAATYVALTLAADATAADAAWKPFARRGIGFAAGAMLAVWGNHLPKLLSPWRLEDEPFDWQQVHRAVGWLAALGGGTIALAWIALPIGEAASVSRAVALGVGVLALGTKFVSLATHSPAKR